GIHIDGISHVINFTLPEVPDDYVHRIGRTGRAGATGTSISFAGEDDAFALPPIAEPIGRTIQRAMPPHELLKPVPRKHSATAAPPFWRVSPALHGIADRRAGATRHAPDRRRINRRVSITAAPHPAGFTRPTTARASPTRRAGATRHAQSPAYKSPAYPSPPHHIRRVSPALPGAWRTCTDLAQDARRVSRYHCATHCCWRN